MVKNKVEVFGSQWSRVYVDPLAVMEAELCKNISSDESLLQGDDKFFITTDSNESVRREITIRMYGYLTALQTAIKFAKLLR